MSAADTAPAIENAAAKPAAIVKPAGRGLTRLTRPDGRPATVGFAASDDLAAGHCAKVAPRFRIICRIEARRRSYACFSNATPDRLRGSGVGPTPWGSTPYGRGFTSDPRRALALKILNMKSP
jgi:hypothetical protein